MINDSRKCILFTGGVINDYNALKININADDYVICADSGYNHARNMNIRVDTLIGDFDSLDYNTDNVNEIIRYPKEKDDTDTMLAIKHALKKGYDNFEIFGAMGNRFDHSYANIQSLDYLVENKAFGKIVNENEELYIIKNSTVQIEQRKDYVLSVFSYTNTASGVSEKGVKYPLDNVIVTQNFPIGISNEITDKFAEITVKDGKLLIIHLKK